MSTARVVVVSVMVLAGCRGESVESASNDATSAATDGSVDTSTDTATAPDTNVVDPGDSATGDSATVDSTVIEDTTPSADTADSTTPDVADTRVPDTAVVTAPASQADCPTMHGPRMKFLAAPRPYCIDETEVTNAHFNEFILASDKPALSTFCSGRMSTLKAASYSTTLPVVNVEWCHAFAYCKWAGKRLCGKHGGGAILPSMSSSSASSESQWSYACRGGDPGTVFPYGGGGSYVEGTCIGDSSALMSVKPVNDSAYPNCHGSGAFASLMHMAGNAREWEDSCEGVAPSTTTECFTRGGSFRSSWSQLNCTEAKVVMTRADDETGFRCCYDGT